MIKVILYSLLFIWLFTSALYLGLFNLLWLNIGIFTGDFIAFIPIELRLWIFFVIFWLIVAVWKSFID